jgi:hypothetical protein
MRYFILLDFQHMVLAFFLGLLAVLFAYVAWCGYPARSPEEAGAKEADQIREGPAHPLPPILLLVFTGTALWVLAYVVVRGIFGGAIS